jgi:hypothetical protein
MDTTYEQLPGRMGLSFRAGDELSTSITFSQPLDGYTVTSSIVNLVGGGVMVSPTTSIYDAAAGVVNIRLTETQTAALPAGNYGWTLSWDAPGDVRRTALEGIVEVTR